MECGGSVYCHIAGLSLLYECEILVCEMQYYSYSL
jgi:hypothetical protein